MQYIPKALMEGVRAWYEGLPEFVREAKYLSENFNFSQKSCKRWDAMSSKCGVTTEFLIRRGGEFSFEERSITLMNFPVSDREDWMDRTEMDDELTVEFKDLQEADTEVILNKKSLADMGLWDRMFSVPGKYADFVEYNCLHAITVNAKDLLYKRLLAKTKPGRKPIWYVGCVYHTGYVLFKQVVEMWEAGNISTEDAARMIGPHFLRDNRLYQPPVPEGLIWQDRHLKSFVAGVERHAGNLMKKRVPERKSWAIAWEAAKKAHPEYELYMENMTRFSREAIPYKNIKLKGSMGKKDMPLYAFIWKNYKMDAAVGAKHFFKQQGMDVPLTEATKAYDWMVCGSGSDKKPSLLAGCPLVTHVPEGKYPVRIILQTAVTDRLQEMYQVDPNKPHNGWVRFGNADMSAVEFNALPLEERKKLLGCECPHCIQRDIFLPIVDHKDKIVFRVASEVMLNAEAFDSVVGLLTELTELGVDAISYGEEDFLRENRRVIDYDFTDLKDDKPVKEEVDEYNWDESPTADTWEHINWDKIMARRDGLPDIHPGHEVQPVKVYIDKTKIVKKK